MKCPWCSYNDVDGKLPFKHVKTIKFKDQTVRGWECPSCNQSFKSEDKSVQEPFYKKENPQVIENAGQS